MFGLSFEDRCAHGYLILANVRVQLQRREGARRATGDVDSCNAWLADQRVILVTLVTLVFLLWCTGCLGGPLLQLKSLLQSWVHAQSAGEIGFHLGSGIAKDDLGATLATADPSNTYDGRFVQNGELLP